MFEKIGIIASSQPQIINGLEAGVIVEIAGPEFTTPNGINTPAELARAEIYRSADKRHAYLKSRKLIRQTLSRRLKINQESIPLDQDTRGQPLPIKLGNALSPIMHTSWARSAGWTILGTSINSAIGVDLEVKKKLDYKSILRTICSDSEVEYLRLDRNSQEQNFWAIWTAKEAILKFLGTGFQTPVRTVELPLQKMLDNHTNTHFTFTIGPDKRNVRLSQFDLGHAFISVVRLTSS